MKLALCPYPIRTIYNKTLVELLRPLHYPPNYQSSVTDLGLYSTPRCHVKAPKPSSESNFSYFGGLRGEAWDKGMNYSDQAGGQDAGVYGVGFRVLG